MSVPDFFRDEVIETWVTLNGKVVDIESVDERAGNPDAAGAPSATVAVPGLALVGRPPTLCVRGNLVRELKRPCVYVWVRGGEVLYVGKGSNGASRPLDAKHHRLRASAIDDADVLLIWACDEGAEWLLEARLIKELDPKLNKGTEPEIITRLAAGTEKPNVAIRRLSSDLRKARADLAAAQTENHDLFQDLRLAADGMWSECTVARADRGKPRNGYDAIVAALRAAM